MLRWTMVVGLAVALAGQGCVSASVQNGAIIGASSGAVAGTALGFAVGDEKLLGSPSSEESGDLSLDTTQAVLSGALIGAVFGGIIGAMVGHQRERPNDIYLKRAAEQTELVEEMSSTGPSPRAF